MLTIKGKLKIIFELAKKELGTDILTLDQITVAYYRLFTAKDHSKPISKPKMNIIVYNLSKRKRKKLIEKVSYRGWRYNFDISEYKLNENIRKSNPNYKRKPVEFQGKVYSSMRELADATGLHYSTISRCYKRYNGDLSRLGIHSIF